MAKRSLDVTQGLKYRAPSKDRTPYSVVITSFSLLSISLRRSAPLFSLLLNTDLRVCLVFLAMKRGS